MFEELLSAASAGNLARIEQFLNHERETTHLTFEEGRQLFKEAITSSNYNIIHALINGRILENGNSPPEYLKPLNDRTIFGYAVLDKFDETALTILSSSGYDILCTAECTEFVSNLAESYNPVDLSGFTTNLNRLKTVLSMCQKYRVQRTIKNVLYNDFRIYEVIKSVEWLNYHFKYGYGIYKFKTIDKIRMELGEGKWSGAINSISSLDENEVNEYIYDSFPPGDDIPRWTILSFALAKAKEDIVKLLLNKGADVNKHSERIQDGKLIKFTPFELAVELNYLECCQLLVENGAYLYLQSSNSIGDILKNAIRHENIALLKLILENRRYSDEDIEFCNTDVEREVDNVEIQAEMKECLEVYRRFKTTEATDVIKAMLIFENDTQRAALKCIQELSLDDLFEEIHVDDVGGQSWSLLTYATKLNKIKIVKALLEKGCDVNQTVKLRSNHNEFTCKGALMFAIEENNCDICKLLLHWGAQLNYYRESVFPYAFRGKNTRILRLLVEQLDDPCNIFDQFAYFADISVSVDDVIDTFGLELLSFILQKSRISRGAWFTFILGCSVRKFFRSGAKRGRHYLLNMLLNFLPCAPVELQSILATFNERNGSILPSLLNNTISLKERDWLRQNVVRCSSLQNLCRFSVRQAVQPLTEKSVHSLGLPVCIEDYLLEHPLRNMSTHLRPDDLTNVPIDQQGERLYLYIDNQTY